MRGINGPMKRISTYAPSVSGGGGGGSTGSLTIGSNYGDGTPTMTMTVGTVTVTGVVANQVTSKDTWFDNVALCPTDTNHNGTPILVTGVTATKTRGIVGFDVSTFPASSSCSAVTLRLVLNTAPAAVNQTIDVYTIAAGGETWAEGTIKCSTAPAVVTNVGSFSVLSTDTPGKVYTVTLSATAATAIATQMGTGTVSFILDNGSATGVSCSFNDKETGGAGTFAQLSWTFQKTL